MFTFDIEALYPSIQVWPGVGGLCLFDVVERAIRCFYSPQPDLVEFLVFCLHSSRSTEVPWSSMRKRIGQSVSGCVGLPRVAEFRWCSQVSLPVH